MGISLGPNQYGKAETRVVRIDRDGPEHQIRDLNVSTSLRGDFAAAYLQGDQSLVLPTDTQKNTVYAYARERGVGQAEDFALGLARHFADDVEPVRAARVDVDEYGWERITVGGEGHAHSFVRTGTGSPDGDGHRRGHGRRAGDLGAVRPARPRRAEVDRVGVCRVPSGPVHDAGRDRTTGSSRPR